MEVFRRAGADQSSPHVLVPDEARDPAEHLDMLSRRGFGPHHQKKQPDGLPIQGIERNRYRRNASDHTELPHRGRLAVRNGDAEPDARGELLLPPDHGSVRIVVAATGPVYQSLNQLSDCAGFVGSSHRHQDALGREQLAQEHSRADGRMGQT